MANLDEELVLEEHSDEAVKRIRKVVHGDLDDHAFTIDL